jgi:thiamine kinase-like enzyme
VTAWPDRLREGLRRLWELRYDVLDATDRLPRTLCHHDVWPMNLVVTDTGPVLFDWSFVGPGPVGEDAANLVLDTFFDGLVDVALLPEASTAVMDAYLSGLAGAVDPATARRAVEITGAAKHFWLAPGVLAYLARGSRGRPAYDRRDPVEVFTLRRPLFELLITWAGTALD